MKNTFGTCRLCLAQTKLRHSHVIPKFVYRWLKEGSATGRFRQATNMSVPLQDGLKEYLFCPDCEERFNAVETPFANRFFRPVLEGDGGFSVDYEGWMLRCVVSMSYRAVLMQRSKPDAAQKRWADIIDVVVEQWRQFLLEPTVGEPLGEHHVFVLGEIDAHPAERDLPSGINWYWHRTTDFTFMVSETTVHSYLKLPGILVLSAIHPAAIEGMEGTRIRMSGRLAAPQAINDEELGTFVAFTRAEEVRRVQQPLSASQAAAVEAAYRRSQDRWHDLRFTRTAMADARLREAKRNRPTDDPA